MKKIILVALVFALPVQMSAQDIQPASANNAIKDAFYECRKWAQKGLHRFSEHWKPIVKFEHFQDRRASLLISDQFPIFMNVEVTHVHSDGYRYEISRPSCSIRLADASRPMFEWVKGTVLTGDHWNNLKPPPPGLVSQQLDELRQELAEVIRICRNSPNLSTARRTLFSVSRGERKTHNDADRLRKHLGKFGLQWKAVCLAGRSPETGSLLPAFSTLSAKPRKSPWR